jgi:hypothetical protein
MRAVDVEVEINDFKVLFNFKVGIENFRFIVPLEACILFKYFSDFTSVQRALKQFSTALKKRYFM